MRGSRRYGLAAGTIVLMAAAVIGPAFGGSASAPARFKSHVTPNHGVKNGTKLVLKSRHAKPNLLYGCALTVANLRTGVSASDENSSDVALVTSSSTGHVRCKLTFKKFHATDSKGHVRHCPLTHRDAKRHFVCGVGIGDVNTRGATSNSFAKFPKPSPQPTPDPPPPPGPRAPGGRVGPSCPGRGGRGGRRRGWGGFFAGVAQSGSAADL